MITGNYFGMLAFDEKLLSRPCTVITRKSTHFLRIKRDDWKRFI
jgi:hypothetical protein